MKEIIGLTRFSKGFREFTKDYLEVLRENNTITFVVHEHEMDENYKITHKTTTQVKYNITSGKITDISNHFSETRPYEEESKSETYLKKEFKRIGEVYRHLGIEEDGKINNSFRLEPNQQIETIDTILNKMRYLPNLIYQNGGVSFRKLGAKNIIPDLENIREKLYGQGYKDYVVPFAIDMIARDVINFPDKSRKDTPLIPMPRTSGIAYKKAV